MLGWIVATSWFGLLVFLAMPLFIFAWMVYVEVDTAIMGAAFFVWLFLFFFLSNLSISDSIGWAIHHPFDVIEIAGVYLVLGLGWATIKWVIFSRDQLKKYKANVAKYKEAYDADKVRGWQRAQGTFAEYVLAVYDLPPQAAKHKEELTRWWMWWPLSLIVTLIGDWVYRFFTWLTDLVKNIFHHITMFIFRNTEIGS